MKLIESERMRFSEKWWNLLKNEFEEEYMKKIYSKLEEVGKNGDKILPLKKDIYKQFKECDYDQTFVIFITPYPIVEFCKSRCFQYMSMLIEYEIYDGLNLNLEDNLDYLLKDGIIHVPTTMTQSAPTNYDHYKLGWQNFTKTVLKHLSNDKSNKKLFIYEEDCVEMLEVIDTNTHQVELLQPGVFREVNKFLLKEYNLTTKW